jgi:hypothetical protein
VPRCSRVVGSRWSEPHSFTSVRDLAVAMIQAPQTPSLWGKFLHAPTDRPITQHELAEAPAAGVTQPRLSCWRRLGSRIRCMPGVQA